MMAQERDEQRAEKLVRDIESRATRHLRATDEYEYLKSDLETIAEMSAELRQILARAWRSL